MRKDRKMKDIMQITAAFAVLLTIIPMIVFLRAEAPEAKAASADSAKVVSVYFTESGEVKDYTLEEYLTGAVLAQMPADFEDEAIKAQAVLAHTYIERRKLTEAQSPTAELKGADISDDTTLYQSFFTEEAAKAYYGDDYEAAHKKVAKLVAEVSSDIITYEGEPIIAAFHAASSGQTQSAKVAWGQDIPYLQSVKSESDLELEGAKSVVTLTAAQFRDKLKKACPDVALTDLSDAENWLECTADKTGYVTKITVCGKVIDRNVFLEAFDIASPCFEFDFKNTKFTFTAQGFGHLVGMSQYGANAMAKSGSDYKAIIGHYFTGVDIQKVTA